MKLTLRPLALDPEDLGRVDGAHLWRATTDDPAFIAAAPKGEALMPGWHRIRIRIDGRSGDVSQPRLYVPATNGGYSEKLAVAFKRDGADFVADFQLRHAAPEVRIDPSNAPCEFACEGAEAEPIAGRAGPALIKGRMKGQWRAFLKRRWRSMLESPTPVAAAQAAMRAPLPSRPPGRKERVLAGIDRKGAGIEIGPSHDPIAPKREGYNVQIIDHASREELIAKYEGHLVSHDRIEEVDFVWRGETYAELTGKRAHYDWIIASHVIEHTPDLVAFLADCDTILKEGGVLSLVIPDKRYVFDRFRPITGLGSLVDAHVSGRRNQTAGAVAEHSMYAVGKAQQLSWSAGTPGGYTFIHSAQETRERIRAVVDQGASFDVHMWCFVPHSFRLLLADLHALGYTRMRELSFHPSEGCEFYVTLGRHGNGPPLSRMEMLREIEAELAAS